MFCTFIEKKYRASVLVVVLVVSTLFLCLLLAAFSLWEQDTSAYIGYHRERQQYENLASAFVCYCAEPVEGGRRTFRLFEEDPSSDVEIEVHPWGLYEVVELSGKGKRCYREFRMVGKESESDYGAVLWYCDGGRPLLPGGKTEFEGRMYVPQSGMVPTQVGATFFQGNLPVPEQVKVSKPEFPKRMGTFSPGWFPEEGRKVGEGDSVRRSFSEETLFLQVGGKLRSVDIRGNVVLYSQEKVEVDSTCRLEDVLLLTPSVVFREGFRGCLQVFATDTVEVQAFSELYYPSGIYMRRRGGSEVALRAESKIRGYIVTEGEEKKGGMPEVHYVQESDALAEGLVYVDGNAIAGGKIKGSGWFRNVYYFTPGGYYPDVIYGLQMEKGEELAFPLWFTGPYRRKMIKWLY